MILIGLPGLGSGVAVWGTRVGLTDSVPVAPFGASCPMLLSKPFDVRECQRKGRGVYAVVPIKAGALIDSAPVLVLNAEERRRVETTRLRHYYFRWGDDESEDWSAALALGHISLCNHAPEPNAAFVLVTDQERIDLVARGDIAPGEEITIDYDCDLWFDVLE